MAAGRRVGLGPRSRPAMAPWKKKRLRKRRTGASQARDSDSEDGEFEIQAEDDARARKVIMRGPCSGPRPAPFRPSVSLIAGPYWVSSRRGRVQFIQPIESASAEGTPEFWAVFGDKIRGEAGPHF